MELVRPTESPAGPPTEPVTRVRRPRARPPLSEVFDEIGLDVCVQLLAEVGHLQPLAARFNDEFPALPKRERTSIGAARMIADKRLDVGAFGNLLVRLHADHMRRLAKIRQAGKIIDVTDKSLATAIAGGPDTFDERRVHMEKQGVVDSAKTGTSIDLSRTYQQQNNFGLPAFEQTVTDIEERMRALPPAATQFVDAEVVDEREEVPV